MEFDGGGGYGGTDWQSRDLGDVWSVLRDQRTDAHFGVVAGWRETAELVETHLRRVTAYRDDLVAVWPPARSPAAAAYVGRLDRLIADLRETYEVAVANYSAFGAGVSALAEARAKIEPLYREWVRAAGATPAPGPAVTRSPATGSRGAAAAPGIGSSAASTSGVMSGTGAAGARAVPSAARAVPSVIGAPSSASTAGDIAGGGLGASVAAAAAASVAAERERLNRLARPVMYALSSTLISAEAKLRVPSADVAMGDALSSGGGAGVGAPGAVLADGSSGRVGAGVGQSAVGLAGGAALLPGLGSSAGVSGGSGTGLSGVGTVPGAAGAGVASPGAGAGLGLIGGPGSVGAPGGFRTGRADAAGRPGAPGRWGLPGQRGGSGAFGQAGGGGQPGRPGVGSRSGLPSQPGQFAQPGVRGPEVPDGPGSRGPGSWTGTPGAPGEPGGPGRSVPGRSVLPSGYVVGGSSGSGAAEHVPLLAQGRPAGGAPAEEPRRPAGWRPGEEVWEVRRGGPAVIRSPAAGDFDPGPVIGGLRDGWFGRWGLGSSTRGRRSG